MAPLLRRGTGLPAVLGVVAFAAPIVQASPQHSTDCDDAAGFEDYCWNEVYQHSADFRYTKCDSYYYGGDYDCQYVLVSDLCPWSCEACLYYDYREAAYCGASQSGWSDDEVLAAQETGASQSGWSDDEVLAAQETGEALVATIFELFCCSFVCVVPIQVCLLAKAHQRRQVLLQNARQGPVPAPSDSCCYLLMCGCVAIYYWEGISFNWFISAFCCPWWGVCCWSKTPYPMDNGVQVLPPAQAQLLAGMQAQCVQPVMQQPNIIQATPVEAEVIKATPVQPEASKATPVQPEAAVVGALVETNEESNV